MKQFLQSIPIFFIFVLIGNVKTTAQSKQPVYVDKPFPQDFSIKYNCLQDSIKLYKVFSDRNGVVQIYSSAGLLKPHDGTFLYPGTLQPDVSYRPMLDKKIQNLSLYQNQFVYLDDHAVLSNAWAGKLYSKHALSDAKYFAGGPDFSFLISDGKTLQYLKDSKILWESKAPENMIDLLFDIEKNAFWILTKQSIAIFKLNDKTLNTVFTGTDFTSFALINNHNEIAVGTQDGYLTIDAITHKQKGEINKKLPCTAITSVQEIDGKLWFGTTKGAFNALPNSMFNYYASKRWLPGDRVIHMAKGDKNAVLILTNKGLGKIYNQELTLQDKAVYFEQQVRARHIRHGFNADISNMKDGDLSTGTLEDSDNDGLWTSMYLGAEVFRYAVTKSADALANCRESMDAMERLYSINPVKGFPARSFERRGYKYDNPAWRRAANPGWDWKSTTSSDEAIGHFFVFAAMAELLDDQALKSKAITLMDSLMQHIVDHDFYLVDWNDQPTQWGRWNPEYVNARPKMVGDRKITSSNIISMLQTAYRFTGKKIYKDKAFELLNKHGYLENLMRPMKDIAMAPENADSLSKLLSEEWNHSDDEMYFLGYWGLSRYAFNDSLKAKFNAAILDHWQIERPEKDAAWNIITAITGTKEFDLKEAAWYLREYPMDLINWNVTNSHRKDIDLIPPNFRGQTTKVVLPPDELGITRHNANRFRLDDGNDGSSESSAGDIWLLPYWMGRYLGVISAPSP